KPANLDYVDLSAIRGKLVAGAVESGPIRIVGGCLSVFTAMLTGKLGRGVTPKGRWLAMEDINEPPYRIDRYLASLKIAGWFDQIAGILIGDFHTKNDNQQQAVLELLKFHLPRPRKLPIVVTNCFGHTWPIVAVPINRTLRMTVRGKDVEIAD
ncbi:MAG: hypothetical protein IID33_17180, partial [Planctomycetes bacterium]|nr:hypothetical protein [Planctomycetota bacterium]